MYALTFSIFTQGKIWYESDCCQYIDKPVGLIKISATKIPVPRRNQFFLNWLRNTPGMVDLNQYSAVLMKKISRNSKAIRDPTPTQPHARHRWSLNPGAGSHR